MYKGVHHPFMKIKFKFKNEEDLKRFKKPNFCTLEITNNPAFSQSHLSTVTYKELNPLLNAVNEK